MPGKILVVDDEEIIRDSLSFILRKEGYEVEEAENQRKLYQTPKQQKKNILNFRQKHLFLLIGEKIKTINYSIELQRKPVKHRELRTSPTPGQMQVPKPSTRQRIRA